MKGKRKNRLEYIVKKAMLTMGDDDSEPQVRIENTACYITEIPT